MGSKQNIHIECVFVAVAEWNIPGTDKWIKQYFGPYDTPGMAKSLRTRYARKPNKLPGFPDWVLAKSPVLRARQWEEI